MSKNESKFIQLFSAIATALIIASIIGLIGMYRASVIVSEKVNANEKKINAVLDTTIKMLNSCAPVLKK